MQPIIQPKTVTVIEATVSPKDKDIHQQKLRVCAYCRVSTKDMDQMNSYQSQIEFYTNKITENPNWKMAGIFADEGVTGTSTRKREQFKKMIRKCKRGAIDLILTKSVSRFARNTLDCIEYVRKLRRMGIGIVFEKEGINTLDEELDETMLIIVSCLAQAESESQSRNVRMGFQQSFKEGNVPWSPLLGYRKTSNGEIEIIPEQAQIVKRIFSRYLAGDSTTMISESLMADGITTAHGNTKWNKATIAKMLHNEKFMGDAILQKTYVADMLTRTVKVNRGEFSKYYVQNNHPAIIDRSTFQKAQEEMARRTCKRMTSSHGMADTSKYSGKYALTERLLCGYCGSPYRRVTWMRSDHKKIVWRCISRLMHRQKHCKHSPTMEEAGLHKAILWAINEVIDQGELREYLLADIKPEIRLDQNRVTIFNTRQRIDDLDRQTIELIQQSARTGVDFDARLKELYMERSALSGQIQKIELLHHHGQPQKEPHAVLLDYDDAVVRWLIDSVTVVNKQLIHIKFWEYGLEMDVSISD